MRALGASVHEPLAAGPMRWWGWGEERRRVPLTPAAEAVLREELGLDVSRRPTRARLEDVQLPDSGLSARARARLATIVGEERLRAHRLARVSHAAGKSYRDLVRLRSGDAASAPDAVVYPDSHAQVAALLGACSEEGIAVVPFGGGTSVVGGVEPLRVGFEAIVSLDLARMAGLLALDRRSLLATFAPGTRGPAVEAALLPHRLTLGHFPQSFQFSTVGGWVATRSAGQASSGYGKIEDLVRGLRCTTPVGELSTRTVPASAAGPSLRELLVGSEGVLGVITEVTLTVRPLPVKRLYEAWSLPSFEAGAEALRALAQEGAQPDVCRLSDQDETRISLLLSATGRPSERLARTYLRLRGRTSGCLAIVGWEGESRTRRRRAATLLRAGGGIRLGEPPARAWLRTRYRAPYLRDELLDRGILAETLETATIWSRLPELYHGVRGALEQALSARGTPRSSSVTSPTSTVPVPRSTSPSSPPRSRKRRSSNGKPPRARRARQSSPTAAPSPT